MIDNQFFYFKERKSILNMSLGRICKYFFTFILVLVVILILLISEREKITCYQNGIESNHINEGEGMKIQFRKYYDYIHY